METIFQTCDLKTIKLQHFGCLLVLDQHDHIVGVSDQAAKKTKFASTALLGRKFLAGFSNVFGDNAVKIQNAINEFRESGQSRHILPLKVDGERLYFKFRNHQSFLYVEWERQHKKYISAKKINEFNFLLDTIHPDSWERVCFAINKLLGYDHVFVLQIQETGFSKVIAEHTADGTACYRNKAFSRDFMPPDVIAYYSAYSYRYVPHIDENQQNFIYIEEDLDTVSSLLQPIPALHQLFLQQINAKSALFFRICIDGQFWGLVIARHTKKKQIDLQQRKLCAFAIQAAASKYESHIKQNLLERSELLKIAEDELKKSLSENMMVNCALVQHMDILTQLVHADGLAIFNQGDVFHYGQVPPKSQFYEIVHFLQQHTDKALFKDYNFRLNHQPTFREKLNFAGLMYLKIGLENDYYLVWFRKEEESRVIQLKMQDSQGLRISEDIQYDTARPWNDAEINFVLRLNHIIKESIFRKLKERQLLNEELLSLNNELEMFTYTLSHDLKNPLSILKMGIQFLQQHTDNMDRTKSNKWYQNFNRSISNIEDIINNMVQLSQHRANALDKEPLPLSYTIQRIFQENKILYNATNCQPSFGQLFPVWGEKSAVYQIFTNLIVNAIKYSAQADNPTVRIESILEDEHTHYCVIDNGIGIPSAHLPHIYEMFSRADNVGNIKGTGIGLSLVKRIMERLGGRIEINSQVNEGTIVHLYFPIVKPFPDHMLNDL
ncbi:GAF domain-containing sensor histidine kinase [Sphingobacterium thalpophilum]|uniref:histidine kinase n=1 Tax=Sphingobacterium thalpophilum TaxID=259 RepID=A0A4V6KUY8_9SPHI|nr:ATP-binding protein [Sphingobacterium thalpophilum]VTR50638.1 Phytochrome-like protein cph1 [Sphingobacterium thalpophilum]